MCLSLPSPADAAGEPVDAPPAPNLFLQTLENAESAADFDGYSGVSPADGASVLSAGSGQGGVSSPVRQLNDGSSSRWSHDLALNSAVAPEAWSAPQENWLLPANDGPVGGESASEVVPTKMGAGLSNLGNTCFLNSILQCFTHTVPLVQGLRSCIHSSPCDGYMDGFCVICALRDQVESSLAASGRTLSPLKFVDNLNYFSSAFGRYQQEDAHEFMQCALDKLERGFLDLRKNNLNFEGDNLVEKVFGGRLISKLQCCRCGHTSDTYEPLIDMSLEIENVDCLPSALESFTKVENIDANIRCDNCKEEVSMEKQLMLDQTPSVAAFHLKRFKTDGVLVEKIDKHIDFPLELDLQPYTISNQNNDVPLKYNLYAIVVHIGFSSTSGHYFCFVRSAPNTWHKMDDSMVTEVSGDSVLSQEAYILFYAREGTPWFSSIMESQTQCSDPNVLSTSPKSVLDVGDSMCKSNPIIISNIERGGAGEYTDCPGPQFDCQERHTILEMNDTTNSTHGRGRFISGSNNKSVDLNGSKSVDAQVENDGFHSITPPSSPRDDSPDQFNISRDHLKREKHGSCKRASNMLAGDSERQAAMKYLNNTKMPGSRRGALLQFVSPKESVDKKRKHMDSSQCKKSNSLGDRKKPNHTSVSRPVAAGISQ
uniref:Ubiquitin carboxyl-terminal hydrolase n=1 Tax=Cajanus cajan TaxID=3821 RepID=A0A151TH92_CAJCA|nr:Ubiquitin carboxyl-terminal hydrolase 20 [Cajanus cajan]